MIRIARAGFIKGDRQIPNARAFSLLTSTRLSKLDQANDDTLEKRDVHQRRTALLWLSSARLRLRDNLALAKATELGPDGLAICLVWPYGQSSPSHQLTPVEAFGYAAVHSLNHSLGKFGQKLWLIPPHGDNDEGDNNHLAIIAHAVQELKPSHVVVDVSLVEQNQGRASKLRDTLNTLNGRENNNTPIVVEVMDDDGLLIPSEEVPKVLGRSRRGGRALRWSTFLSNAMKMKKEHNFKKPIISTPDLPPPLHKLDEISSTYSIPTTESFPSWTKQLLLDWGDISEDEAILRAKLGRSNSKKIDSTPSLSSLTEKGSKDTKLSPYLRWGVISPQRAADAGVRVRDLLWRDWSHVSYSLLGPLRRGDPVLEFMDKSCRCNNNNEFNITDDELFKLWCVGNTGSKLVDAGMKQLWKSGWMPRRIRLLAAACLVEGLGIDWRLGRDWFKYTLIDHDSCINESMWQNAGGCGVDPFYSGIAWEKFPNGEEEKKYVEQWCDNEQLVWPSSLRPYSARKTPPQIVDRAESRREELRLKGVYKIARTVGNAGVRVAWKGLSNSTSVKEGEVFGVGVVPVHELKL